MQPSTSSPTTTEPTPTSATAGQPGVTDTAAAPDPTSAVDPATADRAAATAAVVQHFVTGRGNTFGGDDVATDVLMVDEYIAEGDSSGWRTTGERIDEPGREAIDAALAPKHVRWSSAAVALALAEQWVMGQPDLQRTFIVGVGQPSIEQDVATTSVSTWCGGTCGVGGPLGLERDDQGRWQVTGFIGNNWIS
ncbi:MAG: hypothetical protein QM733_06690 [Ilumatobacteraceae bacterium]